MGGRELRGSESENGQKGKSRCAKLAKTKFNC